MAEEVIPHSVERPQITLTTECAYLDGEKARAVATLLLAAADKLDAILGSE